MFRAQDARELIAIDTRHTEVQKDYFWLDPINRVNSHVGIGYEFRFASHCPEHPCKGFRRRVIIDNESAWPTNGFRHGFPHQLPKLAPGQRAQGRQSCQNNSKEPRVSPSFPRPRN